MEQTRQFLLKVFLLNIVVKEHQHLMKDILVSNLKLHKTVSKIHSIPSLQSLIK